MTTTRTPGLMGRLPAKHLVGQRFLSEYSVAPLPKAKESFDFGQGLDWGMLGNDTKGCCGVAGLQHLRMAAATIASISKTWPDAAAVIEAYLAYTGGKDTGVVLVDFLEWCFTHDFLGEATGPSCPVDIRDMQEVWDATQLGGGLYIGIACTETMQEQFAAGQPLDLTGSAADRNVLGGHCVVVEGRCPVAIQSAHGSGLHQAGGKLVTWGADVLFTERWFKANTEEGHIVFTAEAAAAPDGIFGGVNVVEIKADILARAA